MPRHVVILSFVAWGHLRPECNLAFTLAKRYSDLTVSFIADVDFQVNAQGEINRLAGETDKEAAARVRVIAGGNALKGMTPAVMAASGTLNPKDFRAPPPDCTQAVVNTVAKVMTGEDFKDDNGGEWKGLADKPTLLFTDMFMADASLVIKEKYNLPIYLVWLGCAGACSRLFAPLAFGGQAEGYVEECDAIEADPARSKGRPFVDIAKQMFAYSGRYPNDIVRVKGLKPFYEWEDFPQDWWLPVMYWSIAGIYPLIGKSDGMVIPTVQELDPEGLEGIKEWYSAERSRPVLPIGPMLPPSYLDAAGSTGSAASSAQSAEVAISYLDVTGPAAQTVDPSLEFLNASLEKYGVNSVLYISFGTYFVPRTDHIQYLFDVLLGVQTPIPFIFAAASPMLQLSEELKTRVNESGRGIVVPWAPQQSVLLHPATSYIVSHCGAGGSIEALTAGVPLIAWPQAADQPQNARWLSEVLDVAFELLQVRAGPFGEKKAFRGPDTKILGTEDAIKAELRDVLSKLNTDEGKRKRANAQHARKVIQEARKAGGSVDQSFAVLEKVIG